MIVKSIITGLIGFRYNLLKFICDKGKLDFELKSDVYRKSDNGC